MAEVSRLLAGGADPDWSSVLPSASSAGNVLRSTALGSAVVGNQEDVTILLLDHGADPNLANSFGGTPLMVAAGEGHEALLKLLLARGADPGYAEPMSLQTAFHFACRNNHISCATALIDAGCDAMATAKNGTTGQVMKRDLSSYTTATVMSYCRALLRGPCPRAAVHQPCRRRRCCHSRKTPSKTRE